jgi:glucose-1-phosphate thymidylyltransferase
MQDDSHELVGLIPAAGIASRLGLLPCSKELLPVGFRNHHTGKQMQAKVVSHCLLERMKRSRVSKVFIILRKGKWDIPAYFGGGKNLGMNLAYLMMDLPFGVPYTLDQAYPFVKDSLVVFGFPDILFGPEDAFEQLITGQKKLGSEIVLGIYKADQPQLMDMVDIDNLGCVKRIDIKPASTDLRYTWIIAVWTPVFTRHMHDYVAEHKAKLESDYSPQSNLNNKELHLGHVIDSAIQNGIQIGTVIFSQNTYLDVGTPEKLQKALATRFYGAGCPEYDLR